MPGFVPIGKTFSYSRFMVRPWEGDGRYLLPARKVEPYRLWFEYLKLALKDPDIEVDPDIYADWGDVENLTFDKWWGGATWRNLFAVDTFAQAVRVIEDGEEIGSDDGLITVQISLKRDPNESLRDLRDILEEYEAKAQKAAKPRFALSSPGNLQQGFLVPQRLASVRLMRRLYEAWLEHGDSGRIRRVQLSTLDVYRWAKDWNDKIDARGWKREKTYLPECFSVYANHIISNDEIRQQTGKRQVSLYDRSTDDSGIDPETGRNAVQRWIRKARRLAQNVADGEFPGAY